MGTKKLALALSGAMILIAGSISAVGAVDSYSPTYYVDDSAGNSYKVQARVRNTPYSDHIYVDSFWLRIDVLQAGETAVCGQYNFSRSSPYPYGGTFATYDPPFPLDHGDIYQWIDPYYFNQDMYWSSGTPAWTQHLTSGEYLCGSASDYRTAGVVMYRDSSGWFYQPIDH